MIAALLIAAWSFIALRFRKTLVARFRRRDKSIISNEGDPKGSNETLYL
jgi:hypothetical protein